MSTIKPNLSAWQEGENNMRGLVIRYFMGGYYLCDGKPPEGRENDGELYIGNAVKWFETWDKANDMRNMINAAYGCSENNWTKDATAG